MKKFIIEESEIKRIISMHRTIKEQTSPAVDPSLQKLRDAVKSGCFSNGELLLNKTKNTYFFRGIKKSTKQEIDFFPDMTYSFVDGSKKGKWTCPALTKPVEDQIKGNIEKTKREGNWTTKEELLKTDTEQNLENPVMYEKKVIDGVTHYRRKSAGGIGEGLTPDQKSIIDKWTNKGAKLRKELDAEQAKTWISKLVSPASEGYFSEDLIMYFDPTITVKDESLTATIQNAVKQRIPTNQKDCKNTIETYYLAFKKKRPLEPNEFEALKYKTQACKGEYYNDWGILSGGRRMDNYLDIMSGGIGGPSRAGDDAKWRLN